VKRPICHRLALALALFAGAGCGPEADGPLGPAAGELGPPVVHEAVAADLIEMLAQGSPAVKVLAQGPGVPVATVAFTLDKSRALASDAVHHIIPARAPSAFEVHLPPLPAGSRLVARTFVYNPLYPDPTKADPPALADPAPVDFRILVNGVERARLSSVYVTQPGERRNPYDVMMRSVEVGLGDVRDQPLLLRFETVRTGPPAPEGQVPAEPLWWDLQVVQPVAVPRQAATVAAPNVLLLVVDTLAAGRTSLFGRARDTTPHLRELATRGLSFTRAISPSSWTMPATASLLTGLPPNTHGVLGGERSYLMSGLRTVAEVLREQGLETAGFSANVLLAPATGFDQGFGHFELSGTGHEEGEGKEHAEAMNARLLAWLDGQPPAARWFAWVQYMDPHAPYAAPGAARLKYAPDYVERRDFLHFMPNMVQAPAPGFVPLTPDEQAHLGDLYDAELAAFDEQLGRLLDELRRRGLLEKTLIVLTADHGEELFEHGQLGHGYSLHEELLHVPLIFAGAGLAAGARCEVPVGTAGLAATLMGLANASAPGIEPSLFPPPSTSAGPIFSTVRTELFGPRRVLVSAEDGAGRKLVSAEKPGAPAEVSFYDRRTDPGEKRPLHAEALEPAERSAFEALLRGAADWAARTAAACPPGPQPYSPDIDKALQQIGYTGGDVKPKARVEETKPEKDKQPSDTMPR
jgi:arylsulfatase A-like enzyme